MGVRGWMVAGCLLLAGCSEEKSPPVAWFLEDTSRLFSTLRACDSVKNKPHYSWCNNANLAAMTLRQRSEERERRERLERLNQAPYRVKLIYWYGLNPDALSAVLEVCRNAMERQMLESDFAMGCTLASQARLSNIMRKLQ
ncbi:hypothetical protein JFV28_23545 [Pseudomonas sp. TH05]|uniref:hypothetical protein n=1 Tax=unclassified Pseudomonas TaxID=196821 RepID=UPI001912D3DD|nr:MULTISPECIES: hypothetical protein [unclassified Pseudomonas]MBK5539039.1 hypothetical protein [Pseudomonas sp. TH07]MBK5558807.1 hypothetical protein [Pseudomonas sp. TH05]